METPDPFGFGTQDSNTNSEIEIKGKKAEKVFSLNKEEKKVKVGKKDRLKSRREIRILAETQSSADSLKFGFKVIFSFATTVVSIPLSQSAKNLPPRSHPMPKKTLAPASQEILSQEELEIFNS